MITFFYVKIALLLWLLTSVKSANSS